MQPLTISPLARTYALEDGSRVRLRLARRRDEPAVRRLLGGRGVSAGEMEIRRLLTYDPMHRLVICATAPLGGAETVVGIGAIDLAEGADVDTLVVDAALGGGLGELLGGVLRSRAERHVRRVSLSA